MGKLAQGDANKKVITAGILAPFLYNSIDIAKIPCEQDDINNPETRA